MIAANGHQVGIRTDSRETSTRVVDELGWQPVEVPFPQADLSIDLGSQSDARRPILSLLHGERAMVRSHDPARIVAAAQQWLADLTTPLPTEPFLPNMNAALLPSGDVVITPRWLTSDTALMERFVPEGTQWLDGRHVILEPHEEGVDVVAAPAQSWGSVSGFVLDRGYLEPDLSSPARRTADLLGRIANDDPEQRLDLAARLAAIEMVAVNTEDLRRACLEAKPLFAARH